MFLQIRDILCNGTTIFLGQRGADESLSHAIPGVKSEDILERDAERNWQLFTKIAFFALML